VTRRCVLLAVRARGCLTTVLPCCRVPLRPSCRANPICLQATSPKSALIARFSCVLSRFEQRRVRKAHQKSIHECEKRQRATLGRTPNLSITNRTNITPNPTNSIALTEFIGLSAASIIPKSMLNAQATAQSNGERLIAVNRKLKH